MAKLRVKNGKRRGLDISDHDRLAMLDQIKRAVFHTPVLRPRKCKRPSCRAKFTPKVPWQRYCGHSCKNAECQRRLRERYSILRSHLTEAGLDKRVEKAVRVAGTGAGKRTVKRRPRTSPETGTQPQPVPPVPPITDLTLGSKSVVNL